MRVVYKTERVQDWVGVLTLDKVGYNWRIKHRVGGKLQTVAQGYYYTTDKQKALDNLDNNYRILTGFSKDLFNI